MVIKKFLKTLAIVATVTTMFAVPVFANEGDYRIVVDIDEDWSSVAYSSAVLKSDSDPARVDVYDSNLAPYDEFYFTVVGDWGDNSAYTNSVQANPDQSRYHAYFNEYGLPWMNYRLKGQTYAYYVWVEGVWAP